MDAYGDKVLVKNLVVNTIIGVDAWERIKKQPVIVNLCLYTDISEAGETDHVSGSIHYGLVTKAVTKFAEASSFRSVEALAHGMLQIVVGEFGAVKATVRIEKHKALLHADAAGVEITRTREQLQSLESAVTPTVSAPWDHDTIFVKNLRLSTIIGMNPWEREEKQVVVINLTIYPTFRNDDLQADHVPTTHNYRTIVRTISRQVESASYKTIEAFVTTVAYTALEKCHVSKITVKIEKPSALVFAETAGVEITRDRAWLRRMTETQRAELIANGQIEVRYGTSHSAPIPAEFTHTVYIALGSNLGDTAANISQAVALLEEHCSCRVVDTSFLYETPPMYYTDQDRFLNGACKIKTSLDPETLLTKLKEIECVHMHRVKLIEYGPRPIDLDILFYDGIDYSSERLTIPHKLIQEREFVLRPLCDIAKDLEHPKLFRTCAQLLSQLQTAEAASEQGRPEIYQVLPISMRSKPQTWHLNRKTYVMGILNVTPDSFSDGGQHDTLLSAVKRGQDMEAEGADIIDIGGMSTRPNAVEISEEEELNRVIPVIQKLRQVGVSVPISVDTYRARVAEQAILAGADIINDISGATRDSNMLQVMAKMNVPVCLMHMRGDSKTMDSPENLTYANDDVILDVNMALQERINAAIAAGVHRWNIIIDPGLGFAKTDRHNFEILHHLDRIIGRDAPLVNFPCLMGPSRKRFIGKATNQKDAALRDYGTAAAVTVSIAGGAAIVRVHDVKDMRDVVDVADCIYRVNKV